MAEESGALEANLDRIRTVIETLKSRNAALADENNALKLELESIKNEMGGKLYQGRGTFAELISAVENLRETMSQKIATKKQSEGDGSPRPVKILMTEIGEGTGSVSRSTVLARELLEGTGDLPLATPRIEEI